MSFSTWFNGTAAKAEEAEIGPDLQFESGNHREAISFHEHPSYPLVADPVLVGASEHFSVLRTRLLSAHNRAGVRSVIITSPQKAEGKSLICTNLGIMLGRLGKPRVLMVDGDLRISGMSQLLGLGEALGVGDYLQDKADFGACIRPTQYPSLYIAPAGSVPEDCLPSVLEGTRWPAFIQLAKQEFDLIVIDSVPVTAPIADFELLSGPCDAVLMAVHLRKTTRESLEMAMSRMDKKLLGVIINNADYEKGSEYYSYYYGKKKPVRESASVG